MTEYKHIFLGSGEIEVHVDTEFIDRYRDHPRKMLFNILMKAMQETEKEIALKAGYHGKL